MFEAWPKTIRVVLLDAAGTLLNLSRPVADYYFEAAQQHGLECDRQAMVAKFPQAFRRWFTPWKDQLPPEWSPWSQQAVSQADAFNRWLLQPELREEYSRRFSLPISEAEEQQNWRSLVAEVVGGAAPDATTDQLDLVFESLWARFAEPAAWAIEPHWLPRIQKWRTEGLRVCLASNFDARLLQVMAGFPESAWLDDVFISSDVGFRKPDPQFYRVILDRFGVDPQAVMMFGDQFWEDWATPRFCGMSSQPVPL